MHNYRDAIQIIYENIIDFLKKEDINLTCGHLYDTPHFHKGLFIGTMITGEGSYSTMIPNNKSYFYTVCGTMSYINLYKTLFTFQEHKIFSFGVFTGLSNEYINLSSQNTRFEQSFIIHPILTSTSGITTLIQLPAIQIFNKKIKTLNSGKLIFSIENKIGPSISLQIFKPLERKCRALYGRNFTSDEIDQKMKTLQLNHWFFCTTFNISYGFITLQIGNTGRYSSILSMFNPIHIIHMLTPLSKTPVATHFNTNQDALQNIRQQRDKIRLFYKINDIQKSIRALVNNISRITFGINISADIKEIIEIYSHIKNIK